MSQNVRKLSPLQRIPVIIEGVKDGKNYGEIATDCGVTERTIYRDRQGIPFTSFFNALADDYLADLKRLENGGTREKSMAVSHKGMLVRAMLKAAIPTRIEAKITGTQPLVISFHSDTELVKPEENPEE